MKSKFAALLPIMMTLGMKEKKDDVYVLENPYKDLPELKYSSESSPKRFPLTSKQKKGRAKSKNQKKSRKINRK